MFYSLFLSSGTPIICRLVHLMVHHRSHKLSSLFYYCFFFVLWMVSFKGSVFYFLDSLFYLIHFVADTLYCIFHFTHWILQLQKFCLVLFYALYLLVKFLNLFTFFPDIFELSVSCSSLTLSEQPFLILQQLDQKGLCLWAQWLEDYC